MMFSLELRRGFDITFLACDREEKEQVGKCLVVCSYQRIWKSEWCFAVRLSFKFVHDG